MGNKQSSKAKLDTFNETVSNAFISVMSKCGNTGSQILTGLSFIATDGGKITGVKLVQTMMLMASCKVDTGLAQDIKAELDSKLDKLADQSQGSFAILGQQKNQSDSKIINKIKNEITLEMVTDIANNLVQEISNIPFEAHGKGSAIEKIQIEQQAESVTDSIATMLSENKLIGDVQTALHQQDKQKAEDVAQTTGGVVTGVVDTVGNTVVGVSDTIGGVFSTGMMMIAGIIGLIILIIGIVLYSISGSGESNPQYMYPPTGMVPDLAGEAPAGPNILSSPQYSIPVL